MKRATLGIWERPLLCGRVGDRQINRLTEFFFESLQSLRKSRTASENLSTRSTSNNALRPVCHFTILSALMGSKVTNQCERKSRVTLWAALTISLSAVSCLVAHSFRKSIHLIQTLPP